MDAGVDAVLGSVHALATDDVYAAGWFQSQDPSIPPTAYVLHYDGASWTTATSWRGTGFLDLWAASTGEVFAVGWAGAIARWDGTAWSFLDAGSDADLAGVTGGAADDVYAVGTTDSGPNQRGVILHWDGTAWTEVAGYLNAQFDGVARAPDGTVFVVGREVGGSPRVAIVSGHGESWQPMPYSPGGWLRDAWAFAADDVFAVGATPFGAAALYHYDGVDWSQVRTELDVALGFDGVWGANPAEVWVVNGAGVFRGERP